MSYFILYNINGYLFDEWKKLFVFIRLLIEVYKKDGKG